MIRFHLLPIETAKVSTETLACIELLAFFRGSALVSDLEIDKSEATNWYIENIVDQSQRSDYRKEYQLAEDEMLDSFTTSLMHLVKDRARHFQSHYPLVFDPDGVLCRRDDAEISVVGLSYLVLQFYRALSANLIEFEPSPVENTSSPNKYFEKLFRNLFEYIAGYAVAGSKSGIPHMISDCRSAKDLHRILEITCRRMGSGAVKSYSQWNALQRQANDGGVDCIVHVGHRKTEGNQYMVLVGATTQTARIENKIMGRDKQEAFSDFFAQKPGAFQGALARPIDLDELTKMKCEQSDCLLYTYESIWMGMAEKAVFSSSLISTKRLENKLHKLLSGVGKVICNHNFDQYYFPQ